MKRKQFFTDEMVDVFIALRQEGLSYTKISDYSIKQFGYGSRSAVYNALKKKGYSNSLRRSWTPEMDESLIIWRKEGYSIPEIDARLSEAFNLKASFGSTRARIYFLNATRPPFLKDFFDRPEVNEIIMDGYQKGISLKVIANEINKRFEVKCNRGNIAVWASAKKIHFQDLACQKKWEPVIRKLFAQGYTDQQMATILDRKKSTIVRRRLVLGLRRQGTRVERTPEEIKRISEFAKKMRKEYLTVKTIAFYARKELNDSTITPEYIQYLLHKMGIKFTKYNSRMIKKIMLCLIAGFNCRQISDHYSLYDIRDIYYIKCRLAPKMLEKR